MNQRDTYRTPRRSVENTPAIVPTRKQLDNELLTIAEVAKELRVDETTVRRWVKQGLVDAVLLPQYGPYQGYRVKRSTLERILASAK